MSDAPRYKTLRDYLRVIRERRLLVLGITIVFAAAAYAISARQPDTYRAEAALSFVDPSYDQGLTGQESPTRRTAEREAAIGAQFVLRREIARRVKRALGTSVPVAALRGMVSAAPESQTNLVVVQATGTDPRFVAAVAGEFASQAAAARTAEERRRIRKAVNRQRTSFNRMKTAERTQILRGAFEDRISRLEALAGFAEPAEVVEGAEVPTARISPRPFRSALFGAIIGLTLGLVAAFIRDALDRRLREPQDVQVELGLPLLSMVSPEAFGVAGALRNGRGAAPPEDVEAVRILRRNLDFLAGSGGPRSVAVTSAMAEEGKSTVAASLAWTYVYSGQRTLLIDCDLRRGTLATRLGVAPAPGLTDYLSGSASVDEVMQSVSVARGAAFAPGDGGDPLAFMAAGSPSHRPTEMLESEDFADLLAVLTRSYDRVVLDTSPLLPVADTLNLAAVVDALVICVRASQTTRDQAGAVRAALAKMPPRPTGVVVTGAQRSKYGSYGYYGPPAAEATPRGSSSSGVT